MEQITKTGVLDATLILRQYSRDVMSRLISIKINKPKLTQKQLALLLGS